MPAVSRVGDSLSTGHACVGTTTIASANTDGTVHANGIDIIVITVPDGLYTPSELASTLETLANIAVVGTTYRTEANKTQKVFVKYNNSEKKFYFGINIRQIWI